MKYIKKSEAAKKRGMLMVHNREAWDKAAKSRIGSKRSEESKIKMSLWQKGKKKKPLSKEHKKKLSDAIKGSKHYLWNGGKEKLGYSVDWTRTLRMSIRERDKYTCKLCGEKQGDEAHSVHHIDYNKHNCNADNLITLCRPCHTKTLVKREYWVNYFKKIK